MGLQILPPAKLLCRGPAIACLFPAETCVCLSFRSRNKRPLYREILHSHDRPLNRRDALSGDRSCARPRVRILWGVDVINPTYM